MRPEPDNDPFLRDVLGEETDDAFRAGVLDATLQRVRRQRRLRVAGRAAVAAVAIGLCGLWLWRPQAPMVVEHRPAAPPAPVVPAYWVRSQPLPDTAVVRTSFHAVATVSSSPVGVALVTTSPATVERLDDDSLLELVAGHPAALVRWKDRPAELVFVNSADHAEFLVQ
jgi:hypothetical protein